MTGSAATTVRKVFRYRIYPTRAQQQRLLAWEDALRFLWNIALEQWLMCSRSWGQTTVVNKDSSWTNVWHRPNLAQQRNELRDLIRELPWLADLPFAACDEVLQDLNRSWEIHLKGGGGRPTFKSKRRGDAPSFRANSASQVRVFCDRVVLPKIGKLRMRMHRPLEGKARSCTVVREIDQWFAAINCEVELAPVSSQAGATVALDRGVVVGVADSDGRLIEMPRPRKAMETDLRRAARRVERHERGSKRQQKARARLAKLHRRIARVRRDGPDGTHRLSRFYADRYATVVVEKLHTKNMTRSASGSVEQPGVAVRAKAGLNRSILDMGWASFAAKIRYKLAWKGGSLLEVPAAYSSQTCAECGVVDPASRPTRDAFVCASCGHTAHADTNAAKVLLTRVSAAAPVNVAPKKKTHSIKNKRKRSSEVAPDDKK